MRNLLKSYETASSIALDLFSYEVGDYIPTVTSYENKLNVSRGSAQNAVQVVINHGAIKLKSRGHIGSCILEIDYIKLMEVAGIKSVVAVMPLPCSPYVEGLASAMSKSMEKFSNIFRFACSFSPKTETRVDGIMKGKYDFAIMSKASFLNQIQNNHDITAADILGDNTYSGDYKVLLRDGLSSIKDVKVVGYNNASYNNRTICKHVFKNQKVEYKDFSIQNLVTALLEGSVDCVIRQDYDIKRYHIPQSNIVDIEYDKPLFSNAVIAYRNGNYFAKRLLESAIDSELINKTQKEIVTGQEVPYY